MTRRIFQAIFFACLCVLTVAMIGTVTVLYRSFSTEQQETLQSQARMAARILNADPDLDLSFIQVKDVRVSLIAPDGGLLFDSSSKNLLSSVSHADRQEIVQAREKGEGFALRHSDTLLEDTYYAAVRLDNGSYLRLSRAHSSLLYLMGQALFMVAGFAAAAIVISLWLARMLSRSIVEPINAIDPDHPLESVPYPQLQPLLTRLENSRQRIAAQMNELEQKQQEFDLLSAHMDEGLLLVGSKGNVLSSNAVMQSIYGLKAGDEVTADSSKTLRRLMREAYENGRAKVSYERGEHSYHLEAIRVDTDSQPQGVLVLALDVSEREEIRKQRQEFTANVTHELKTPLQSILSSAELMQSGLVQEKDLPRFSGYIYQEAQHMSRMISDIIHLSRLDVNTASTDQTCALDAIIHQSVDSMRPLASMQDITLREHLQPMQAAIEPGLAGDMISSLLENAILYNRQGGQVDITLKTDVNSILLIVSDTGMGIDPALQSRIFERFFTADPSHNRKGTGLGLAIVKHAAKNCGGSISLVSSVGEGSTFTIRLPISLLEKKAPTRD